MTRTEKKLFKIYVLGNYLSEQDSLIVRIVPFLKKSFSEFDFIHLDPTENFPEEENLILIDSIHGTKKILILNEKDIEKISLSPNYSVHDFDLGMQLKLMKKLGKIKKFKIICVPYNFEEKKAVQEIGKILRKVS